MSGCTTVSAVDETPETMAAALEQVRVLEVGRRLGVAGAGLALAALGADVAQVRLAGRQVPRAEAVYYDRGRRVVDLTSQEGTLHDTIGELASIADVIVTDLTDAELERFGIGADVAQLRGAPAPQVLVVISSLGRSGPNQDFRMTDITEWASTGLGQVTRRPYRDLERYVPVLPPGFQPQALSGIAAATAVVAGRRWARTTGAAVVADVSVQEVLAAMLHGIFPNYVWGGVITGHPSTPSTSLGMLLPAADGDVYIRTLDPRQWDALTAWIGDETVAALGADPDSRLANNDALLLLMGQWSAPQARLALLEEGQRRHIPIALPRSLDDVLAWQQLRARGVWRSVDFEGVDATVPRVPLMEPASWRPSMAVELGDVVAAWGGTP